MTQKQPLNGFVAVCDGAWHEKIAGPLESLFTENFDLRNTQETWGGEHTMQYTDDIELYT